MKDNYIAARMHQLGQSKLSEDVDFHLCEVVKEYIESGRADEKANEAEQCTFAEVSKPIHQAYAYTYRTYTLRKLPGKKVESGEKKVLRDKRAKVDLFSSREKRTKMNRVFTCKELSLKGYVM